MQEQKQESTKLVMDVAGWKKILAREYEELSMRAERRGHAGTEFCLIFPSRF